MIRRFVFFKRDELQRAKQEKRNPQPGWSIETDMVTLSKLVNKYDLESEWIHS